MQNDEQQFLESYNIHDYDIPLASVDMVIFSIIDASLHVLTVERNEHPAKGERALPGGFIDIHNDKSLDDTAYRKLSEKTGIASPYLEQVESIGSFDRDPRGWSVTVLYYALIDYQKVNPSEKNSWLPIKVALSSSLAFDHHTLLNKALDRLQAKTRYTALPIELMPGEFTLTELQTIFETILGKKLPTKSFRRRVLDAEMVMPTGNSKISGKRSAQLFKSTGQDRESYFPRPLK